MNSYSSYSPGNGIGMLLDGNRELDGSTVPDASTVLDPSTEPDASKAMMECSRADRKLPRSSSVEPMSISSSQH